VFEFFAAIGIPICEVWGMSELSCVATLVPREQIRFGTVGLPLPGVEIKLADENEILARGEIVVAGYRNQPEKTAEMIDADGWLHTGDIEALYAGS
jgi:long-chain acyl-CoA synthetase